MEPVIFLSRCIQMLTEETIKNNEPCDYESKLKVELATWSRALKQVLSALVEVLINTLFSKA